MADAPQRKWLPRTPYLATPEAGCCQVCGMEDGKRFKLGVGTAWWNDHPVHDACEQWITTNPDGSRNEPPSTEKRGGYTGSMPRSAVKPPVKVPSGSVKASARLPEPAPHGVMLRFPGITAQEVLDAKAAQRGGHPILVTGAKPGDSRLCFYGLPDIPKYLTLDDETVHVTGGGPLEGGFTLVMLLGAVAAPHKAGTLAMAGSEPPHAEQCTCSPCFASQMSKAMSGEQGG